MKEKFIKFLKEKGVYEEFERNLKEYGRYKSFNKFLSENQNRPELISIAFIWNDTGNLDKWIKLNEEWINLVDQTI